MARGNGEGNYACIRQEFCSLEDGFKRGKFEMMCVGSAITSRMGRASEILSSPDDGFTREGLGTEN